MRVQICVGFKSSNHTLRKASALPLPTGVLPLLGLDRPRPLPPLGALLSLSLMNRHFGSLLGQLYFGFHWLISGFFSACGAQGGFPSIGRRRGGIHHSQYKSRDSGLSV